MGQRNSHGVQGPPVGIFWDMKSCQIPTGVNHADLAKNIRAALRYHLPDYQLKEFFAYGDPSVIPQRRLLRIWERDGMNVHDVGHDHGDFSLARLMFDHMASLSIDYAPLRSVVIVLISREPDIVHFLWKFNQNRYRVVLVCPSTQPVPGIVRPWLRSLLLDWLSVASGSGQIFPMAQVMDDKPKVKGQTAAQVMDDKPEVEGHTAAQVMDDKPEVEGQTAARVMDDKLKVEGQTAARVMDDKLKVEGQVVGNHMEEICVTTTWV